MAADGRGGRRSVQVGKCRAHEARTVAADGRRSVPVGKCRAHEAEKRTSRPVRRNEAEKRTSRPVRRQERRTRKRPGWEVHTSIAQGTERFDSVEQIYRTKA